MHIILLNSRHGSARTIHLNLRWLLLSVVLLLGLSLGAGAALGISAIGSFIAGSLGISRATVVNYLQEAREKGLIRITLAAPAFTTHRLALEQTEEAESFRNVAL